MDQIVKPSPRIAPLPPEHTPELREQFETMQRNLGFVPILASAADLKFLQR